MTRWLEEFLLGLLVVAGRQSVARSMMVHDEVVFGWNLQHYVTDIELRLLMRDVGLAKAGMRVDLDWLTWDQSARLPNATKRDDHDPDPTAPRQIPRSKRKADR